MSKERSILLLAILGYLLLVAALIGIARSGTIPQSQSIVPPP